jgi:hypothetical protein
VTNAGVWSFAAVCQLTVELYQAFLANYLPISGYDLRLFLGHVSLVNRVHIFKPPKKQLFCSMQNNFGCKF